MAVGEGQTPLTDALREVFDYVREQNEKLLECEERMAASTAKIETGQYTPDQATLDFTEGWAHAMATAAGWIAKPWDIFTIASAKRKAQQVYAGKVKPDPNANERPPSTPVDLVPLKCEPELSKRPPLKAAWIKVSPSRLAAEKAMPDSVTVEPPAGQATGVYVGKIEMRDTVTKDVVGGLLMRFEIKS